jgi:hypothetical protein
MKKGFSFAAVGLTGFMLLFLAGPLGAQEATEAPAEPAPQAAEAPAAQPAPAPEAVPAAATEEAVVPEEEYSFGTVSKIAEGELVVTEYDYDKDADVEVTYSAGPDVKLTNAAALSEIKAGDSVDITYVVKDGKKVATEISVEEPFEEEEAAATEELE